MSKSKNDNYYIFRVEGEENGTDNPLHPKKIEMFRFHADSDEEAYNRLKKYIKTANRDYRYHYSEIGRFVSMNEDGSKKSFNDMFELMEDYGKSHSSLKDRISLWFSSKKMRFDDFKYGIRNAWSRIRTGHSLDESWSIFDHILDDLEYNIPILMETVTVPAYYETLAYKKIHDDASNTEYFEPHTRRVFVGNEEQYLIAKKLWNADLEKFLEDIRLWRYYDASGLFDRNDKKYIEIDSKYRSSLPFKPGRYREIDWKRMNAMKAKVKNRIFEFLRKYSESLGD